MTKDGGGDWRYLCIYNPTMRGLLEKGTVTDMMAILKIHPLTS